MGATLDADTAVTLGEQLIPGLGAVMGQVLDINDDLAGDVTQRLQCDLGDVLDRRRSTRATSYPATPPFHTTART